MKETAQGEGVVGDMQELVEGELLQLPKPNRQRKELCKVVQQGQGSVVVPEGRYAGCSASRGNKVSSLSILSKDWGPLGLISTRTQHEA